MDYLDKVLKLIEGGFTKEEIQDLLGVQKNVQEEKPIEDVQKNVQAISEEVKTNLSDEVLEMEKQEKEHEEKNMHANPDVYFNEMFKKLNDGVEAFNKKIQSFNKTVDELDVEKVRSDSDIIAEIITPKGNQVENK